MSTFKTMSLDHHEQMVFCRDEVSGLQAIIAIHNTNLGPGLGGCRMYPYGSEAEALEDVLRLSKGMTYKAAISGLNFGGAKAVIIGDPRKDSSEFLFRAFGRYVQTLNGRYITCEDVGTNPEMMEYARIETKHVVGLPAYLGGLGDPSPVTAYGTMLGMKASWKQLTGRDSLDKVTVAVQGLGHVGYHLCSELHQVGAKLIVSDINSHAVSKVVKEFNATAVEPAAIYQQPVDIFAPSALGGIINSKTISQLKCAIVAGAANNQLANEQEHSEVLHNKGILYAPDYVINAGGLISAATEFFRVRERGYAIKKSEEIYNSLTRIYKLAASEQASPQQIAQRLAEQRINIVSQNKLIYARR